MPSEIRLDASSHLSLYDEDFAAWIEEQVELLRAGRVTALDALEEVLGG